MQDRSYQIDETSCNARPDHTLGQHLARLEMRIFFEELLERLDSIELAGVPRRSASTFVSGPKNVPVRFKLS
jgi:cytochrome P450